MVYSGNADISYSLKMSYFPFYVSVVPRPIISKTTGDFFVMAQGWYTLECNYVGAN